MADIDTIVRPIFEPAVQQELMPGLCYGIIRDGELVATTGLGVAVLDGQPPDAETIFRIASMTKSFTAATVLSLRDEGAVGLDDAANRYVRELRNGAALGEQVTVRQLLTMTAGFPTDDPWGDRQQDLPHDAFRALLSSGVSPAWRPGDLFEYSNMGYAILGLVIEAITGRRYSDVVQERVLTPLGMEDTGYTVEELPRARLAIGYVKRFSGWAVEPIAGYGAFAPMGGLLTTVADLSRWVIALLSAADVSHAESPVNVSLASLREMQTTQRLVGATSSGDGSPVVSGYGYGLFEEFLPWGRTVFHSGGYPGFGSHMRWHPASGLGVLAMGNSTYAPMYRLAAAALEKLVTTLDVPKHRPLTPVEGLLEAEAAVIAWLSAASATGPEEQALRSLFAMNVEQDVPREERLDQWGQARASGALHVVPDSRQVPAPATVTWKMASAQSGEPSGELSVTVLLSPVDTCLIQGLTIKPHDPSAAPETAHAASVLRT